MKKVYYDLETTNIDPLQAQILEVTFIFVENQEIKKIMSSRIKVKRWESMKDTDKAALKFNGIKTKEALEYHNRKAKRWQVFCEELISYYTTEFNPQYLKEKIALSGWNNASYDDIILKRYIPYVHIYFHYNSRDVMRNMAFFNELRQKGGLSLMICHKEYIGTRQSTEFHNSLVDSMATFELDEWLCENVDMQIKNKNSALNEAFKHAPHQDNYL